MTGDVEMSSLAIRTPLEVLLLYQNTTVVARDTAGGARSSTHTHDGLQLFGGQVEACRSVRAVN